LDRLKRISFFNGEMMKLLRVRVVGLAVLSLTGSSGLSQTPSTESDALRSLLAEVRQLRIAIQSMTVASQRVQIALVELQIQQASFDHAAQRLDSAHNRCVGETLSEQHFAGDITRLQGTLDSGTLPETQAKEVQSRLGDEKNQLDAQTAVVQSCQAAEAEASGQLEDEKKKLNALQDRIESLDSALKKVSSTY
jgi:chromosome segregation ATPase